MRYVICLAVAIVVLGIAVIPTRAAEPAKKPPHILYIFSDDQSYRTVGCYPEANSWVRTPNIDALAKSGVRVTHCYNGTWCTASRATMLTGHHPYGVESLHSEGQ